jgi:hypothetical protein
MRGFHDPVAPLTANNLAFASAPSITVARHIDGRKQVAADESRR